MGAQAMAASPIDAPAPEDGAPAWTALPVVAMSDGRALRAAIRDRTPLVLADLARDWPALHNWTPESLAERYGEREVRVYDASFGTPGPGYMTNVASMSFAEFLTETQKRGRDLRMFLYNLSQQIPPLLDDIHLPAVGLRFSRRFVFSFFGCRGSTTPLHYDIDMGDVLHTVIRGRRRVRLFPPQDSALLYRHPCTVRSYVDLDKPDFERFPAFSHARGYEVILEAGQTLYMPAGWWHEFHYLEAGIGVSLRATSPRWSDRIAGAAGLLLASPLDRLANHLAPQQWYRWKCRSADRAALARVSRGRPQNASSSTQAEIRR